MRVLRERFWQIAALCAVDLLAVGLVSEYRYTHPAEPERCALYCRSCRALLSGAGTHGYVIADLHDPDTIAVYPTREGTECFINGYKATVAKKMIAAFPEGQVEKTEVLVIAAE